MNTRVMERLGRTCGTGICIAAAALVSSCAPRDVYTPHRDPVALHPDSPTASVASAHPLASRAGIDVLRRGGNAVDAAIATAFALAVVEPHAGGLGGGGFLVYFQPETGQTYYIDYRETASHTLQPEHYMEDGEPSPNTMRSGGMSVGAPGMVRGLLQAHERFGTLPLEVLLEDAARHAEEGFPVSSQLAVQMNNRADLLLEYIAGAELFLEDGMFPREEDSTMTLSPLAATIRNVIAHREQAIYGDEPASQIASTVQETGGILTTEDVQAFQPRWREPLRGSYRGYDIVTAAPPSGGGIQVLQILSILESFPVGGMEPHSPEYLALLLTAIAAAQEISEANVADPDMHPVPVGELLSPDWAAGIAGRIDFIAAANRPAPLWETAQGSDADPGNTTHLSVIDTHGGAVALTQTVNSFFGSGVVVEPLGVLLNNELLDFDFETGAANAPAAGKIPRSNMAPTLVFKDGRLIASIGTPGGRRIAAALAQIIINKIDFDMPLQDAIDAPRIFVEHNLGRVSHESRIPTSNVQAAVELLDPDGFRTVREMAEFSVFFGGAQGCWIEETPHGLMMTGAADPRRDGYVEFLSPAGP